MSRNKIGALPRQTIIEMFASGCFPGASKENVQPASLDLSVTDEIYRVPGITLPYIGESIRDLIHRIGGRKHNIDLQLEAGAAYLLRLQERMKLPKGVYGFCNPKSTTGRNDIHSRVMFDGVPRFDALFPKGCSGELWDLVVPHSYPIILREGIPLSQLRMFTDDTRLSELDLQLTIKQSQLLWNRAGRPMKYEELRLTDKDGSIILTPDLNSKVIGYEGLGSSFAVNLSKRGYQLKDYFRKVETVGGALRLKRGRFYILSTAEFVRVPPHLACEMRPMDDRSGDFRAHYAGFIDPGWGWGKDGRAKGRPLTLEVRPMEEDILLYPGQPIAKIRFERMAEEPDVLYDAGGSNYSKQSGPKLAKHFSSG